MVALNHNEFNPPHHTALQRKTPDREKNVLFLIWIKANHLVGNSTATIPKKLPALKAENRNKRGRLPWR
jgi:hypothetical protein